MEYITQFQLYIEQIYQNKKAIMAQYKKGLKAKIKI